MSNMMFTQRNARTCPWGCCGDMNKGGKKRKRERHHRTLRTRENRAWKREDWA